MSGLWWDSHYDDVIMTMLAFQITSLTVVYSIVYSGVNQRKHQSSASLAFVREIHRGPVNFPHKWPVTRKMFPFDDVIMCTAIWRILMNKGPGFHSLRICPSKSQFHVNLCLLWINCYDSHIHKYLTCTDSAAIDTFPNFLVMWPWIWCCRRTLF